MSSEAVRQECLPLLQRPGVDHQVVVYEKNEKLGKKLYITGKGRCNITNACDMEGLFERSEQMQSFYTVVFMDTRISR